MVPRLCVLIVLAFACVSAAPEAPPEDHPEDQYSLERADLISNDHTLVVKLSVDAPKLNGAAMTKLVFRWRDETSVSIANGMHDEPKPGRRAEVLIVAQVAAGTPKHPPMLMLSTQQQAGNPGAFTFQAHRLPADAKLPDVVKIDAEPGQHAVGEKLQIGVLGGDPVFMSLERYRVE